MKKFCLAIATLITTLTLLAPSLALADKQLCADGSPAPITATAPNGDINQCPGGPATAQVGKPAGLNLVTPNLNQVVPNLFKIFFIVGAIAVVLMLLWGAVEWIFSGGDKEKVGHARSRIINGIIGFAILALAFLIAVVIGRIVGFNPLQNFDIPFLGGASCPVNAQGQLVNVVDPTNGQCVSPYTSSCTFNGQPKCYSPAPQLGQ